MKRKKLFALALFTAVALFATSCENDDNWKPTWAVPLVKEMTMRVCDFIDAEQVEEFNQKIKQIWVDYVTEEVGLGDPLMVDTVAYKIITDTAHHYVDYGDTQLNQATIDSLLARGVLQAQIDEINTFLSDYSAGNTPATDGNTAMTNLLLGAVGSSNDLFVTAANMMEYLQNTGVGESYAEEVEAELDSVLQQANMDEFIPLNLSELSQGAKVTRIDFDMDIENTMPFSIKFKVSFMADSVSVQEMFDESLEEYSPSTTLPHFGKGGNELDEAFDKTTAVRLKVDCTKQNSLTPPVLRTLGEKGIVVRNMRVKVQAGMSSILNQ